MAMQPESEMTKGVQGTVVSAPVAVSGVILGGAPSYDPTQYISGLCCWDNCACQKDCGLCCYTQCCPYCAYADIMGNIEEPTCCCPVGFGYSLACVMPFGLVSWAAQLVMNSTGFWPCAPYVNIVPCITCTSREALGAKYGLPTSDCCCSCCAHYCCQTCALYQESVYVKHVLKKEPTCCCYDTCQDCCGRKTPGEFPLAPVGGPQAPDACLDTVAAVLPFVKAQSSEHDDEDAVVTQQPL